MRDPIDVLAAFFFGRRALGVLTLVAMLGAGVALAGCAPAQEGPSPAPAPAAQGAPAPERVQLAPGAVREIKLLTPIGSRGNLLLYVVSHPESGCEYLMGLDGSLTPNMGRSRGGSYLQRGCRLGSFEDIHP